MRRMSETLFVFLFFAAVVLGACDENDKEGDGQGGDDNELFDLSSHQSQLEAILEKRFVGTIEKLSDKYPCSSENGTFEVELWLDDQMVCTDVELEPASCDNAAHGHLGITGRFVVPPDLDVDLSGGVSLPEMSGPFTVSLGDLDYDSSYYENLLGRNLMEGLSYEEGITEFHWDRGTKDPETDETMWDSCLLKVTD